MLKAHAKEDKDKKNIDKLEYYYARVRISADGSTIFIRILSEDFENPPYRLENYTHLEIKYR